jgi:CheY-like chemotaxis protein
MQGPLIRVLLLEDDDDDVIIIREFLLNNRRSSYEVDWARNHPEAIQRIERKAYDICLVDYQLGADTGFDFIAHCARAGLNLPIILLTGREGADMDIRALQAGAADYLQKTEITGSLLDKSIRYAIERLRSLLFVQESRQLLASALDALSSHIAILDGAGIIVAVNRAWRTFGEQNGLRSTDSGVGTSYLDVCDKAAAEGDEIAGNVHRAIRDIVSGRWSSFAIQYTCHSIVEQRWFYLRITRFLEAGAPRIVVAHELVMTRRASRGEEAEFTCVLSSG